MTSKPQQPGSQAPRGIEGTRVSRRTALRQLAGAAAVCGALGVDAASGPGQPAPAPRPAHRSKPNLVQRENERRGTLEWQLTKTGVDPKTKYRCPWIEGYCSATSVTAGEKIRFFVSTNPPTAFTLEIYRMGYYGGTGGRLMRKLGPFSGSIQTDPPIGPNRVRECRWDACAELTIPRDWLSGVYLGKLTATRSGWQSYVIFIVKDQRRADFLFQCSDNTWQAYNRWPSQFALYDDGKEQWYWGPGVDVCFDRPYGKYCQILDAPLSTGSGEWFLWEFPTAYWMESQGYDVSYISNFDTHTHKESLLRAKALLSNGHDEYYSIAMFENLRWAIGQGLNIGFLSGNTACGRIDPRPNSVGTPDRVFSRVDFFGPPDMAEYALFPSMARLPHQSPNANLLVGARSVAPITGGAAWTCVKPEHWLFEGTGMKSGDGIPGLVGWEWHGDPAPIPGLEIVASGKTQNGTREGLYTATLYPGPKGNLVFNASTCWWSDALSEPPGYVRPEVYTKPLGPDPRAQRITRNLLDRFKA